MDIGEMARREAIAQQATLYLCRFNQEDWDEREVQDVRESVPSSRDQVIWLDVKTNTDSRILEALKDEFSIDQRHLLTVQEPPPRPRTDGGQTYIFVATKNPWLTDLHGRQIDFKPGQRPPKGSRLRSEFLFVFLGPNWLVTIQERPKDVFGRVRNRLRSDTSALRAKGADFLALSLLEAVVDYSLEHVEGIDLRLEEMQRNAVDVSHDQGTFQKEMVELKNDLYEIRKLSGPHREALYQLESAERNWIRDENRPMLASIDTHIERVNDLVDVMLSRAFDVHEMRNAALNLELNSQMANLTKLDNRINHQMRTLTLLATLILPMSVVAGFFGMNLKGMPWSSHDLGFWFAVGASGILGLTIAMFVRRAMAAR